MTTRHARRSDRASLAELRATDVRVPDDWRARRKPFSGWWEVQAQSLLRGLRPPLPPSEQLLLAVRTTAAGEQVMGAVHYEVREGQGEILVGVVDFRWHRHGVGRLLMRQVLDLMWSISGDITVVAHESNAASRALLEASGFSLVQCEEQWALYALVKEDRQVSAGSARPPSRR